jgi:hypothetical protein
MVPTMESVATSMAVASPLVPFIVKMRRDTGMSPTSLLLSRLTTARGCPG